MEKEAYKKSLVFYRSGMKGGSATLSYRIGKRIREIGWDVYYLYKELNDDNNYILFDSSGFFLKKQNDIGKLFHPKDRIIILTYSLQEHVEASKRFRRFCNSIVLFYPISNVVSGSEIKKIERVRPLGKAITKSYFKSINDSKLVFYTHEKSVIKYENYYKIDIKNAVINPIPISAAPFDEERVKKRYYAKEKIIISFLRADFPLKGYVFPLIKSFSSALLSNNNIRLLLIVQDDKNDLVKAETMANLPDSSFTFMNGCSYNELIGHINNSYVNVGHGTSVLDASSVALPTIIAVESTYDDICCGFFGESNVITGKTEYVEGNYITFIDKILGMSYREYYDLSKKSYDLIVNEHSINSFVDRLIYFANSSNGKLRIKCRCLYFAKTKIDCFISKLVRRK